jgi:integrase/recombinase XerD
MKVKITPRITRNKQKIYYTLAWGKKAGQRRATGTFTYVYPVDPIQKELNKEAFRFLEIKKSQLILDAQAIGTGVILK